MTQVALQESVAALKAEVLKLPQVELPTTHKFHGGMYCRQMTCPEGALIVGKVHKKEHFFMVVSGTIAVTVDGEPISVTAPHMLCCAAGAQRAIYAETDAVIMTLHRTDAIDVEAAEADLVEDDPDSAFGPGNLLKNKPQEVLT